jgi:hypothetical protein
MVLALQQTHQHACVAQRFVLIPQVCFVRHQQILAISMHHALLLMVLLSILKVVRAERVIALLLPMACFVHRPQILAVMHHVLSLMVVQSILKVVLAERVIAQLLPVVCFVRRPQILAVLMRHALLQMVLLSILKVALVVLLIVLLLPMACFVHRHSILAVLMHHAPLQMAFLLIQEVVLVVLLIVLHPMDCIVILLSTNAQKLVGVKTKTAKLKIRMIVLVEEAAVPMQPDYFANFLLVNVQRLLMKRCQSFVFFTPQPVAMASGAKWQR